MFESRENAFVESFNGRLRDKCLNATLFFSLDDARGKLETWRVDYNTERAHISTGNLAPEEFAKRQKPDPKKDDFSNLHLV
ncbi:MAG: hypothetical protein A2036_04120 [Omnitrophica bacterium GWA2_50_21]|nr:MAG: hypothetical protein A2036_04120 [Omnitrophica bacterium GWA2_50_21]